MSLCLVSVLFRKNKQNFFFLTLSWVLVVNSKKKLSEKHLFESEKYTKYTPKRLYILCQNGGFCLQRQHTEKERTYQTLSAKKGKQIYSFSYFLDLNLSVKVRFCLFMRLASIVYSIVFSS